TDSEISMSVFEVRSSDEETTPANDRFFKADSETVGKTNEVNMEKPKSVQESVMPKQKINRDKVIIEDWPNGKRAVHTVSTARPISTARLFAPKIAQTGSAIRPIYPRMDSVRPRAPYSPIKRSYYTKPTFRPKKLEQDVKTSRVKNMTTAGTRAVVSTSKGKMDNALKKSRWGNPEICLQDHVVVDSGCSSHMTGNKAYLSYYEDYNGGFVAFGSDPKGGKIIGKGKIKTAYLDFDDVYFVDELKFNLFSVSQMCDKKNSVLFTDTECLILSPSFKLLDESQVVLRAPRQNDVYSLDLKNIVPSGGITCLYANATSDESKLWHRRLGHVNFKNINKLVKGHLVRGLPSKVFVNDHTCVACKKGKQHKASCKAKLERTIRKPLELLHMDLFGPVLVESINKKKYCLVVTDDFSRFSWVFFLASKDETNEILYKFITGLENQLNLQVKIIRSDNGTEFKNHAMNVFCAKKGIKREFSVARTLQQNEAVNTACYVLNRVLVTKPQNKTHYGLLIGSSGNNKETPQEYILLPLHPHGPRISVKDVVLDAKEKPSENAPKDNDVQDSEDVAEKEEQHNLTEAEQALKDDLEKLVTQEMIAKAMDDATRQAFKEEKKNIASTKRAAQATSINKLNTGRQSVSTANTPYVSAASTPTGANTGESSFVYLGGQIPIDASTLPNADLPTDPNMPDLEDDSDVFSNKGNLHGSYDDERYGRDPKSAVQTRGKIQKASSAQQALVSYIYKQNRTNHKDHQNCLLACFLSQEEPKTISQALADESWVEAMQEELLQFKLQKVWILVELPYGKKAIGTKWVFRNKRDERSIVVKNKARLVVQGVRQGEGIDYDKVKQQPDGIFIIQDKYVGDILKKFDFWSIRTATTPIKSSKPLVKDEDDIDVDVHVYQSMIGSLMYLTASRPDIMFVICACARHQVTTKASHLNAVKRIFRYLKHQPKLGLWYPRDSPFELEAYSDSDYGGASLDRKSTTGGY
ncbi:putative ribonuclease H-like domain-containing protein, partial [Tanacetum coccineum]